MGMNSYTRDVLFTLIQSKISTANIDTDFVKTLSPEQWEALYRIAKAHDVAHLLAPILHEYKEHVPDEIFQKYHKQWMIAVYRYEKINHVLKKVSDILEGHKIAFLPLKGAVLRQWYPEPWMRTSCDIDLLVHPDEADLARDVLYETGFSLQKGISTYDYQMMSPNGIHLELHFSLQPEASMPMAETILDSVWDECEVIEGKQFEHSMSNEMFLFYHVVHMAKHFAQGGCGIRPLIDLWLMMDKMEFDANKLHSWLLHAKLLEFYHSSLELCKVWMENAPHNDTTLRMEQFILTGGVYGTISNAALMKAARGESRLRSFLNLLFLSRENLEAVYPELKKHPGLFPLYQVKRWFGVFNRQKRKKIQTITSVRNAVDRDKENLTRILLQDLGLQAE